MHAFRRTAVVLAGFLAAAAGSFAQPTEPSAPDVAALARAADFIGFVRARPATYYNSMDRSGGWDILGCLEVVKGEIPYREGRFSNGMLMGERTGAGARAALRGRSGGNGSPSSGFNDDGFYLLFAARGMNGRVAPGTILAAYRVEYHPNGQGRVTGCLTGYPIWNHEADIPTVCQLLRDVLQGNGHAASAASRLSTWLQSATLATRHEPSTTEERLRRVQGLAASIIPGTPRGDVEKIFLQRVGGPDAGDPYDIYDAGNAVSVEVPYDGSGCVSGPLKVYRRP